MTETEGLFEDPTELTEDKVEIIASIDDPVPKEIPAQKGKKKREMTPEAKEALLERLAKGRAKAAENRKVKAKAKEIMKKKKEKEQEEARRIVEENAEKEKPVSKAVAPKLRQKATNSDDYNSLKKELAEIKQLLKDRTISESKKVELKETQKELKQEIKESKPVAQKKKEPAPQPVVVPPKVNVYSTLRNRKKKNIRRGF